MVEVSKVNTWVGRGWGVLLRLTEGVGGEELEVTVVHNPVGEELSQKITVGVNKRPKGDRLIVDVPVGPLADLYVRKEEENGR